MIADLFDTQHTTLYLEIEPSNRCNARCSICPTTRRTPPTNMDMRTFCRIIESYVAYRPTMPLNRLVDDPAWPVLFLAGGGEPLINPQMEDMVGLAARSGFQTILVTNAALLTKDRIKALEDAGLAEVYVSFIGIKPDEYRRSMGIDYDKTYANVMQLRESKIPFRLTYTAASTLESTDAQITAFWQARKIEIAGPNPVWNRGGHLEQSRSKGRPAEPVRPPRFDIPCWCLRLKYWDSISANGDYVMCCCDYFGPSQPLGNLAQDSLATVHGNYARRLEQPHDICRACLRPDAFVSVGRAVHDFLRRHGFHL